MKNKMKFGIKTKIILSTMFVIASIVLVLGIVVYTNFSKILLGNIIDDNQKRLAEISNQLDSIENQMDYIADYIITDTSVAEYTHVDHGDTQADIFDDIYHMKKVLTRFVVMNEHLTGVYLLRDDGVSFTNDAHLNPAYVNDYIDGLLNKNILGKWGNRRFTNVHEIYANNMDKKMQVITYISRYSNIKSTGETNYLFLDVSYNNIINIMKQGESEFDNIILLNKENERFYGEINIKQAIYDELIQSKTSKIIEKEGYIYILNIGENSNWKTIVSISKSKLLSTITPVMIVFIIAIVLSFFIIMMIIIPILGGIINPIKDLSEGMKLVSAGDYKVKVHVRSGDEIEELADGFNDMTTKIEKSIEQSVQYERTKRKLQLDLLINQINPHFIYNTLNTVIYLSRGKKTDAVEEVTYSLINVLQDSVKIGKQSISDLISVEIEIIKNYMRIQKYRYPDMFELKIECDDDLLQKRIPKMVIQPLVENALFHGVCLSGHPCEILVSIKKVPKKLGNSNRIEICIMDNGVGMDDETKNKCFQKKNQTNESNQTRGIGLANISERLQFIYGDNQSIQVFSKANEGTKVVITIPELGATH